MSADSISTSARPSWRARRYGYHRAQRQNVRAYLFANREGRRTLRTLWRIRWSQR